MMTWFKRKEKPEQENPWGSGRSISYYEKKMLEHAKPAMKLSAFGQSALPEMGWIDKILIFLKIKKRPVSKHKMPKCGEKITFRRQAAFKAHKIYTDEDA